MKARRIYRHLYFQVLTAIAFGVLLGYFYPETGAEMKPLGDLNAREWSVLSPDSPSVAREIVNRAFLHLQTFREFLNRQYFIVEFHRVQDSNRDRAG